jgi:hypothetical protein
LLLVWLNRSEGYRSMRLGSTPSPLHAELSEIFHALRQTSNHVQLYHMIGHSR